MSKTFDGVPAQLDEEMAIETPASVCECRSLVVDRLVQVMVVGSPTALRKPCRDWVLSSADLENMLILCRSAETDSSSHATEIQSKRKCEQAKVKAGAHGPPREKSKSRVMFSCHTQLLATTCSVFYEPLL